MSDAAPQYVTVEQFNALVEKCKKLAKFANDLATKFNELTEQVEQLRSKKPAKKTGFTGRSAELEAEVADITVGDVLEIDNTDISKTASKLAAALAKGNGQ